MHFVIESDAVLVNISVSDDDLICIRGPLQKSITKIGPKRKSLATANYRAESSPSPMDIPPSLSPFPFDDPESRIVVIHLSLCILHDGRALPCEEPCLAPIRVPARYPRCSWAASRAFSGQLPVA